MHLKKQKKLNILINMNLKDRSIVKKFRWSWLPVMPQQLNRSVKSCNLLAVLAPSKLSLVTPSDQNRMDATLDKNKTFKL
jgi:hypothetical protein|tara:strand:+ start:111 stop:350 length:240 start_codon:yes stop_codon:yes gene_type:complete